MGGLARICKMYGSFKVGGVLMVWDYANDVAVPEHEMPLGSDRWRESEKVRWGHMFK